MDLFQSLFFYDVVLTFDCFSLDALGDSTLLYGVAGAQRGLILGLTCRFVVTVGVLLFQSIDAGFINLVVLNCSLNCILIFNTHDLLLVGFLHEVIKLVASRLLCGWHIASHKLGCL